MPQYETIVVFDPALSDEAVDGEVNQIRELILRQKGAVSDVQKWGKKRLAYEVRRRREGHYVLLKVDGPPALVPELERHSRVSEPILRLLTVRAEPRASAPPPRRRPPERAAEATAPAEPTA